MQLVIVFGLALFALGLAENFFHRKNLRSIPIRILVNGTRGKSSVTRLIAGALREAGYRTIAKTTGSDARVILEDGNETPVKRPLGPRITEQKGLARLAARQKADALVVECMAVRPESQMLMRSQLVRPTITVITNARVDHVEEMGPTIEDTEAALSFSIPPDGTLVTADPRFSGASHAKAARRIVVANSSYISEELLGRFSYPAFPENLAIALQVASELGIDREKAIEGMIKAEPDVGVLRLFKVESPAYSMVFINGFAANDVRSTEMVWAEASRRLPDVLPLILLYNNRADREYRVPEFLRLPRRIGNVRLIVAMGEHPEKVARSFRKLGLDALTCGPGTDFAVLFASLAERLGGAFLLFGVGNIHGMGETMVTYCAEHGFPYEKAKEGKCCRNR
ncbi:MAG TPA: poly-gamma-glutamate synthase PgsB [Rectinemataceae bacterium]|nr:poly-gamma-glutamate synthase PgsB [Rectinemataceae bacterium]